MPRTVAGWIGYLGLSALMAAILACVPVAYMFGV